MLHYIGNDLNIPLKQILKNQLILKYPRDDSRYYLSCEVIMEANVPAVFSRVNNYTVFGDEVHLKTVDNALKQVVGKVIE